jgi:hypothetical protein
MTDHEQKELRAYCAFLLKEYGFQFSTHDPVIPALYTIHKQVEVLRQSNHELAALVKEASSKINPVSFHFNYKGEAWRFQMGIAIRWISFGLLLALFATISVWYWSMKNEIDHVRMMNETFEKSSELNKLVKKQDGLYFIDFTAAKGDSAIYFKEYRKLNARTVRVYLGKERKQ